MLPVDEYVTLSLGIGLLVVWLDRVSPKAVGHHKFLVMFIVLVIDLASVRDHMVFTILHIN